MLPFRAAFVFIASFLTVGAAFLFAFWVRFDFSFPEDELPTLWKALPLVLLAKLAIFYAFRLYSGMWRFVSIADLVRIFSANVVATGAIMVVVFVWHMKDPPGLSRSVLVLDFMVCFFAMSGKRMLVRVLRETAAGGGERAIRTLVVGAPDTVNSLLHAFSIVPGERYVIGALCEGVKAGRTLRGIRVFGDISRTGPAAKKHEASEILLLPPYTTPKNLKNVIEQLESENVHCALRMLPDFTDIAHGNINVSNIKEVEIEDLLGRSPVKLDNTRVSEFVKGRSVMVTGAGGSIGSELCRQIAAYGPSSLALFELSEFNLYEISMELGKSFPGLKISSIVGDVRSGRDITRALLRNRVEAVYHAAAFKHVPMMEDNPAMAVENNILGTAALVDACERSGVKRMVLLSTDKAVGPTSVMGATKRIAERIVLERAKGPTEFVAVRFGNVLDSRGSVIPLFKKQIKDGGPVTVTSENVTRFFMSIPEAVDLVLQAGAVGKDRDIMVLEMGEPVRIMDMARKLIELSGLTPGVDIEISVTGMRPGEKEFEELLTSEERVVRTPYNKIFVARKDESQMAPLDFSDVRKLVDANDTDGLRGFLKKSIPDHQLK